MVDRICSESRDFSLLLKSPIVKTDQKIKIVCEIFTNKIQKLSLDFLKIIINKKREYLLEGVVKAFIALYKAEKNIETATVTTAVPISSALKEEIVLLLIHGILHLLGYDHEVSEQEDKKMRSKTRELFKFAFPKQTLAETCDY